jgi:hypothetical protein
VLTARATGKLKMQNSRSGDPVVRIRKAAPGDVVRGRVTLNHRRTTRVVTYLSVDRVRDAAGPNGGKLSRALRVRVIRLRSHHRERRLKYRGGLTGIERTRVGIWHRPHKRRSYAVSVRMRDHGTPPTPTGGDNAYQGSRVSFRLVWSVRRRS